MWRGHNQCPPPLSGGRPAPVIVWMCRAPVTWVPSIQDAAGLRMGGEKEAIPRGARRSQLHDAEWVCDAEEAYVVASFFPKFSCLLLCGWLHAWGS